MNEVAKCWIEIGANLSPLQTTLGGLAAAIAAPITGTAKEIANLFTGSLQTATASMSDILQGNVGRAIERSGNFLTGAAGRLLGRALTAVLGETVGGTIGSVIEQVINGISHATFGLLGKSVNAILHPVQMALAASPGDFNRWISQSILMEQSMAKFNATLKATGGVTGWTADQMKIMRSQMSEKTGFGGRDLAEAQEALMRSGLIRGDIFKEALAGATSMAAMFGGDAAEAAHTLAYALSEPEIGIRRLARSTHIFTQEQMEAIKEMAKAGDLAGAQRKILDVVSSKGGGVAAAMADTVQGQLNMLRRQWEGLWRGSIGDTFLPLVRVVTDGARGVVGALGDIITPLAAKVKDLFTSWAATAHGWIAENSGTFKQWASDIGGIAMHVFNLIGGGLKSLFSGATGESMRSFWEDFKTGVSSGLTYLRVLTGNWELMKLTAQSAWAHIKDYAIDALSGASAGLGRFWDSFLNKMERLMSVLGGIIEHAGDLIGQKIQNAIADALPGWLGGGKRNNTEFLSMGDAFNELLGRAFDPTHWLYARELPGAATRRLAREAIDTTDDQDAFFGGYNTSDKASIARKIENENLDKVIDKLQQKGLLEIQQADALKAGKKLGDPNAPPLPGGAGAMTFTGYEAFAKQIQEQLGGGADPARDTAKNTGDALVKLDQLNETLKGGLGGTARFA